jgi:hypothetical protein
MKVPLIYGDPNLDSFEEEYRVQRLQRLQTIYGWTNENIMSDAINIFFGVSNLNIAPKPAEEVHFFGHRAVFVTNEFFSALDLPEAFDFNQLRVVGNPNWQEFAANPHCQQFVQFASAHNSKKIAASLNKMIYLIGLNTNINAVVKNTSPVTFKEA